MIPNHEPRLELDITTDLESAPQVREHVLELLDRFIAGEQLADHTITGPRGMRPLRWLTRRRFSVADTTAVTYAVLAGLVLGPWWFAVLLIGAIVASTSLERWVRDRG